MREINTDSEGDNNSDDTGNESTKPPPPQIKRVRRSTIHLCSSSLTLEDGITSEILAPIKLELEVEGYRLHDAFLWNLNETKISPEDFAEVLCVDLAIPRGQSFVSEYISQAIRSQLREHMELVRLLKAQEKHLGSQFTLPDDELPSYYPSK